MWPSGRTTTSSFRSGFSSSRTPNTSPTWMRYCSGAGLGTRAGCRRRRWGRPGCTRTGPRSHRWRPSAQDIAQPHTDRRQSPECDPAAGRPAAERKHAQRNRRLRYPGPSTPPAPTPLRPRLRDCGGTALLVLRVPPSLVATWLAIDTARLNLRSFCSDRPILRPSLLIAYPGATDCARFTSDNLRIESSRSPKSANPGWRARIARLNHGRPAEREPARDSRPYVS